MNEEDLTGKTIQGYFVQKPIGLALTRIHYSSSTRAGKIRYSLQSRNRRQENCCFEKD